VFQSKSDTIDTDKEFISIHLGFLKFEKNFLLGGFHRLNISWYVVLSPFT